MTSAKNRKESCIIISPLGIRKYTVFLFRPPCICSTFCHLNSCVVLYLYRPFQCHPCPLLGLLHRSFFALVSHVFSSFLHYSQFPDSFTPYYLPVCPLHPFSSCCVCSCSELLTIIPSFLLLTFCPCHRISPTLAVISSPYSAPVSSHVQCTSPSGLFQVI